MNTQYSSLEDAFPDKPWPKKGHSMTSSKHKPEEKRDPEKEGRTFPTPIHRSQHAIQTHKKTIDDLTGSLPISHDDEESNFAPARIPAIKISGSASKENFEDYAYAPPAFQQSARDLKLERLYALLDQQNMGGETPAMEDLLLYVFSGVFMLFAFDTFVKLGRHLK